MTTSRSFPRVTLTRVAAQAGVSTTTASLILSGRPECLSQFNEQTIARVRQVAQELGYGANLFATSLHARGKGSSFFALVLNSPARDYATPWLYRAFDGDLLAGVLQAASERSLYPVVATAGDDADEPAVHAIEAVMAGGVFGTIVRSPSRLVEERARHRLELRQPLVTVFPNRLSEWQSNAIDVDNIAIGTTAARLLLADHRERPAVVYDRKFHEGQMLRCQGFRQAVEDAGRECLSIELPASDEERQAQSLIEVSLREHRLDAVFIVTLDASIGALQACIRTGLVVGQDVSIVGCDCSLWNNTPLPQITSVDVAWSDAGYLALQTLSGIVGEGRYRFDNILMPPRVAPGQTCPMPGEFTI